MSSKSWTQKRGPNRTEPNNKNKQQHEKMIFDNAKRSKDLNVDQFYFLKLALSH